MPKVTGAIDDFLRKKKATGIATIPHPGPNQRGPTCGFYALSFVMNYWHLRTGKFGGEYEAKETPLPARTNLDGPVDKTSKDREKRDKDKDKGTFTSLRQYGKFKNLTAFGSVFNADDLLTVARGDGAQYGGRYDGKVVAVTSTTDFADKVRRSIALEVPVIVPYDAVGDGGEPGNKQGGCAHWVVIFGLFTGSRGKEYAVYFTWGDFYYAPLSHFATSNDQLTSNSYVLLQKVEVRDGTDVVERDYVTLGSAKDDRKSGYRVKKLSPVVHNPEFNNPTRGGQDRGKLDNKDGRVRMQVGGLRRRFVVVFRAEDREFLTGQLPFLA